jgi:putative transposase
MRHVDRNPVRAKTIPVRKAERWRWSTIGKLGKNAIVPLVDLGPVPRSDDWLAWVNEPQTESELESLRACIARGKPFGSETWQNVPFRPDPLIASS